MSEADTKESSPLLPHTPTDSYEERDQALIFSQPPLISPLIDPLPVWKKLCYAVGAMPYAMCNTVIGFYISIFLLEVAMLDPLYVLIIVFSSRVWDALTDPTIGYLCNRTNTRLGKLRPWLLGAMVPAAIIYFSLWFVPPGFEEVQTQWKFIYYLVCYFAFQTVLSCIHVPYTSLTMHLSHNNKERDSATLYRMVFEVIGTLLGVAVYTIYFIGFVSINSHESDCTNGKRESDLPTQRAYRYHALTLGVLIIIFISTTFLSIREQKDVRTAKTGFLVGIKTTLAFRPYLYLFLLELFGWLAIQFVQGNLTLYVKYSLGLEDQYPYVIAVLLVATILWMPLWQVAIVRIGKRKSYILGMWVFMISLFVLLFIDFAGDKGVFIIYANCIVGGGGVAAAYLLPWSMLPDVVDEAFLETGVRREELFYAFFVFGTKFAGGVGLGISTGLYKIVNYDESKCDQPWTVSLTLRLLVSAPPIIFVLMSLFFLHCYPITEERRAKTKKLLEERRRSSAPPTSPAAAPNTTLTDDDIIKPSPERRLRQGYVRRSSLIRITPHHQTQVNRVDCSTGLDSPGPFSDTTGESSF